jgi:hypothetical protein
LALAFSMPKSAFAMAQITMVNRTQYQLTLYISDDGGQSWYFGCGPVLGIGKFANSPGMFCTSSITAGPHVLDARKGDEVMQEESVNIKDGTSPSWTVNAPADPDEELIKSLNGARYYRHGKRNEYVEEESALEIRGTTLIFIERMLWARPDIAKSMADGTNGFTRSGAPQTSAVTPKLPLNPAAAQRKRRIKIPGAKQLRLESCPLWAILAKPHRCGGLFHQNFSLQTIYQSLVFRDQRCASLSSATLDFKQPLHQLSEGFHDFLQGWRTDPALQWPEEGGSSPIGVPFRILQGIPPLHFPRTIRPSI